MNWDALGAIADTIAGIGVIVTLWYLAVQIRQNTKSVRASAYQTVINNVMSGNDMLVTDPELSRIYHAGIDDLSALSIDEAVRFHHLMNAMTRRIESVHLQDLKGLIDAEDWSGFRESGLRLFSRNGAHAWWADNSWRYNDKFAAFIDSEYDKRSA